ncbi:hypothetical protein [Peribacillus butanolivorans]|uniref:hypothetical protein n=1 Tax=Peribacillus butanolivorans TaxID=421767 RepID=UPI0020D25691|nr:hypothetical protein [Peribacillus butanolivorans]
MDSSIKRHKLFWFNLGLTILVLAASLTDFLPLPALFMLGFAIIMIVNYPNLQDQKDSLHVHAGICSHGLKDDTDNLIIPFSRSVIF